MLPFIWDKVSKVLPFALLEMALGLGCYLLMKSAGEDAAALVGLFTIGIGFFIILLMVFYALRDVLRWRRDFHIDEALDDFRSARQIHRNLRVGRDHLFFNNITLEYRDIEEMLCTYEHTVSNRGYVTYWYTLYAVRSDGKKFRVLPYQEKKHKPSREEATELFTRILDIVREKNAYATLKYPHYE